jgi:murein DD-endopeptidase MepM/ murein hydrolase activator NlpD
MEAKKFEERLRPYLGTFAPVVPMGAGDKILAMDFTAANLQLTAEIIEDTDLFIQYINSQLSAAGARYGVGGYNEHRTIYSRSRVFDAADGGEPRRLHLGIDIWGKPLTRVMAPLDGIIHSFGFHHQKGDYGTTIILTHQLDGMSFHTLYGHLSLGSIANIQEGDVVRKGDVFAAFGLPFENGNWPPHLHFQLILDMEGKKGDYPGVCRWSERERYLENCPDPGGIVDGLIR